MATNNRVQVTLGFNADTTQAQQAIRSLNQSLNQIQHLKLDNLGINREINEAADAAKTLQTALQAALNIDTGQINMTKFSQQLKLAGTNVSSLSISLQKAGQIGTTAFIQTAQAVSLMDIPLKQTNKTLQNMMTTLKNTAKWELSSSLIHGLESSFSSAINYIADLNEALTDIRVVSGQSIDNMKQFAEQANQAAKALGTTTKEYARAALTYYQQGDTSEMAAKKAEITLKATNVAFKATAQEMSEMLTSTWNGFQAGAEELEHYVDVMANLGSHTASSVEEIATALQKVAATANTVGVSMEQMSAMIATVSSTTRQAAATVGTAMNTILSRFASLKLGETLEDGLDLTKYTKALASIGVNVLDTTGNLREMGSVVEEIMEKWQTMNEGQRAALAQTVGGVRQYTNIMALFNNQDKYYQNLDYAQNSEGSLEKMQQTYLTGLEGARKQLKASTEDIWQDIIDDQALINGTKLLTQFVEGIHNIINSLGGLGGIAASVGGILMQVFSKNIASALTNVATKITTFRDSLASTPGIIEKIKAVSKESTNQRIYEQQNKAFQKELEDVRSGVSDFGINEQLNATQILLEKKQQLVQVESSLSDVERSAAQAQLSALQEQANQLATITQEYTNINTEVSRQSRNILSASDTAQTYAQQMNTATTRRQAIAYEIQTGFMPQGSTANMSYDTQGGLFSQALSEKDINLADKLTERVSILGTAFNVLASASGQLQAVNIGGTFEEAQPHIQATIVTLESLKTHFKSLNTDAGKEAAAAIDNIINKLNQLDSSNFSPTTFNSALQDITNLMTSTGISADQLFEILEKAGVPQSAIESLRNEIERLSDSTIRTGQAGNAFESFSNKIQLNAGKLQKNFQNVSKGIGNAATGFMTMSNMISNWDTSNVASKVMQITMSVKSLGSNLMAIVTGGPIGKIMGVIGLIAQGIGLITGAQERNKKQLEEQAKEARTKASNTSSETEKLISDNRKLVDSYNELYAKYQESGEVTTELITAAQDLADAYNIQDASIALLNGDIEAFNNSLHESLDLSKELKQARINVQQSREAFTTTYQSAQNDNKTKREDITRASEQDIIAASSSSQAKQLSDDAYILPTLMQSSAEIQERIFNDWLQSYSASAYKEVNEYGVSKLYADENFQNYFRDQLKSFFELTDEDINTLFFNDNFNAFDIFEDVSKNGGRFLQAYMPEIYNKMFESFKGKNSTEFLNMTNPNDYYTPDVRAILDYYNTGYYNKLDFGEDIDAKLEEISDSDFATQYNSIIDQALAAEEQLKNATSPLEQAEAIKKYTEIYAAITEEMSDYDKDDQAYKLLEKAQSQVGKIANNEDLTTTAQNYLTAAETLEKLDIFNDFKGEIAGKSLENIGADEITGGFNKLSDLWQRMAEQVKAHEDQFESLDQANQTEEEYNAAVDEVVSTILTEWGAIDDSVELFKYLKQNFKSDELSEIISFMASKDITDMSGISKYLSAIKFLLKTGQSLSGNKVLEDIANMANTQEAYDTTKSKVAAMQSNESLLKKSMSTSDLETLYQTYWDGSIANIKPWEEFIELDYDARKKYIESITQDYIKASEASAEKLIEEKETYKQDQKEQFLGDRNQEDIERYYQAYLEQRKLVVGNDKEGYKRIGTEGPSGSLLDAINAGENYEIDQGTLNFLLAYEDFLKLMSEADAEIDDAKLWQQVIKGYGDAADSAATKITKLASAFSSLPTSTSDMDDLLKVLSSSGIVKGYRYNGSVREGINYTATDLLSMSDSELEALMIKAQEELVSQTTGTDKEMAEYNLEEMRKTHAKNDRDRDIADEQESLTLLQESYKQLSSIDITKMPEKGTQAYQALSKALESAGSSMAKFAKASSADKIDILSNARKKALEDEKVIAEQIANTYNTRNFTADNFDQFAQDKEAREEWIAWYEKYKAVIQLDDDIAAVDDKNVSEKIKLLNEQTEAIEKRLNTAKAEADKLKTQAATFSNAVETGKLSATDKAKLSEEDITRWDELTSAEERAAFAAKKWQEAIIANREVYEEQQKAIENAQKYVSSFTGQSLKDETSLKTLLDKLKVPTNIQGELMKAFNAAQSEYADQWDKLTNASKIEKIKAKLIEAGDAGKEAMAEFEAYGIDAMEAIWDASTEQAKEAAKKAVETWKSAYDAISKARQKAFSGENIQEDVLNDQVLYTQLAKDWIAQHGSLEGFNAALANNEITPSTKNVDDYIKLQQAEAGLNHLLGLSDEETIFNDAATYKNNILADLETKSGMTKDDFYKSENYQKAQEQADQIMRDQLEAILKGYDPTFTDAYIKSVINGYIDNGDLSVLEPIVTAYNDILTERTYGLNNSNRAKEAEAVNAQRIEDMQAAHDFLAKVASGSADNLEWYKGYEDELQQVAKYLGVSEKALKDWGLENVQSKLLTLADALDDASAASKDFQKALNNGDFEGKTLTSYTTADGHRIWTDDNNQFTQVGNQTYSTQEEAYRVANLGLGQKVVQDSKTGKWIVAQGGYDERSITSKYGSESDTNYGETTRRNLSEGLKETQSQWIENRDQEFAALDKVQAAYLEKGKTAEDQATAWESFYKTLDTSNESLMTAVDTMYKAEAGSKAWLEACGLVTQELLKQGNTQKTTTKELEIAVAKWKEAYKITDKYGNTLTAASINLLKFQNGQTAMAEALSKSNKELDITCESMADLRREAKNSGQKMSEFTGDIEDLSDEAKTVIKDFDGLYDAFDDLRKMGEKSGDSMKGFDEDLATAVAGTESASESLEILTDELMQSISNATNTSLDDAFTVPTDSFIKSIQSFEWAVEEQCKAAGIETTGFLDQLYTTLNGYAGDIGIAELGTLAADLQIDLSGPLGKILQLARWFSQLKAMTANGNVLFPGAANLASALQAAHNAGKGIQSKYGGGGGGGTPQVKNDYTPKSSGGGGNKTKKALEKMQEDERERYHEITKRIDEQSKALNKLDKIKSGTFGANRVKAINDEITALKKEKVLYQELATEANRNMVTNRAALAGFGATFNSDGTVNYDEFINKINRELYAAKEKYNETAAEDQKKAKIDLDYAQERFESAKKALEKYEEDMQKVQEAEENVLDIVNQISAKTLEDIEYKIDVKFDINDRDIKYMQYLRNKWEDVLDKSDESMEQMINEAMKYVDNLQAIQKENDELYEQYQKGDLTMADFTSGLKTINDKSNEMLENLITIKKQVKEAYGNTLENANNELSKHTAVLEHSYTMMEKYIQIQQLIGMGTDYAGLKDMYNFQYKSSLASVNAAKLYLDVLKDEEAALQRQIDAYGWTEILKQQWEDLQERIRQGEEDLADKTSQTFTTARNGFINAINAAIDKFDEFVFGVKDGLSDLERDYEYYQEEQERYLSTSKELYEVAKLNREINGSLNDVTSQLTKTRLRELKEEINSLSEKNRLTEYDVQMLELQYKYALALEDLEDKKNAKSVVRLTRDENGNYGYQYTANSEEIDKAAQQVDDVLQQINELAASRTAEIEQAAISARREYYQTLQEMANDQLISDEEYMERAKELTKQYTETMQFHQEQYNNASNSLLTNQEYVYKRYGVSIMENTGMIQDQMSSAIADMINKTDDWSAYLSDQLQPGGEIYEALESYRQKLDETNISAGLGDRQQAVQNMTKSIDDLTEANEAADVAIKNVTETLDNTLKGLQTQTIWWNNLTKSIQDAVAAYEQLSKTSAHTISELGENTLNTNVGGEDIATKNKNVYSYSWIDEYGITHPGDWSYDSYSSAMEGAAQNIKTFYSSYLTAGEDDAETAANKEKYERLVDAALGTRSAPSTQVATFLHGGMIDFTGPAWVDGSTSAPESILNAGDTAKMLRMTELIHSIDLEALRLLYDSINQSALGMMYPLNGLLNSQSINPFATELQQHVTITAEFPNATDHSEIEQAFEDIVNLAAQYAGRK